MKRRRKKVKSPLGRRTTPNSDPTTLGTMMTTSHQGPEAQGDLATAGKTVGVGVGRKVFPLTLQTQKGEAGTSHLGWIRGRSLPTRTRIKAPPQEEGKEYIVKEEGEAVPVRTQTMRRGTSPSLRLTLTMSAITDEVQLRKVGLGKLSSKDKGSDRDEAAEKQKEEPKASDETAVKQSVELPKEDSQPKKKAGKPSSASALSSSLAKAASLGAPQEKPVKGPTDGILVGMEDVAGVGNPLGGDVTDSEPPSLIVSMTEGDRSDGETSAWTMSTCREGSEDKDSEDEDFGMRLEGPQEGPQLGPTGTGEAVLPQEEEKEKEPALNGFSMACFTTHEGGLGRPLHHSLHRARQFHRRKVG
uniref:Uncharacterized protein n=1 Tax=Chromera velia CCMP2878 TaxID=1169474 RepID=A0A0G4HWK2_9ALVE|eukprot:Cvel_9038.t1-p1 / transcript=Cvel_9038.t1 / gene=Cvel_9038 / organism=Chromera_velia_CCMP2878 / gene_product=hypothetical protein / transcript_product=hypothetical protein / location=Cvel_scaffold512:40605-42064(-) / protein_length=357 / sequence_SO=supercontig / SO=protein_coding / is_pseudo=false